MANPKEFKLLNMTIQLSVPTFQGLESEALTEYMELIRKDYKDRIEQAAAPKVAEIRSIVEADTENPDSAEGNIWRIIQGIAQSVGFGADYSGTDVGAVEFRTVFQIVKEMVEEK